MLDRPQHNGVVARLEAPNIIDASSFVDEPVARRRLSVPRVALAVLLVGGALFFAGAGIRRSLAGAAPKPNPTWFAPYVDATLTPVFNFQNPAANPARQLVLGFVVAEPSASCTPSWGGFYTLAGGDAALNLGQRIAQYRALGGGVAISFGGQANHELAVTCTSTDALEQAYASVVQRFGVSTLDFDIEGAALQDSAANKRRADALRLLEQRLGKKHPLQIWLTVPVATDGIGQDGIAAVSSLLAAHVAIAGVNVMTMDFGSAEKNMASTVEGSLNATSGQLAAVERRYGITLTGASLWNHLGATVMIGQNDTGGERFNTGNATSLVSFARSHHLGRVSMWSLNRDASCGSSFGEVGVLSNTCSGVTQSNLEFTHTFDGLSGAMSAGSTVSASTPKIDTNPANAPYPLWQPSFQYEMGYKVVRDGEIYQAKWYNQGQDPEATVTNASETPWLLIGPVLPTDRPAVLPMLPAGTDPAWKPSAVYQMGSKVLYNGLPYQAAWYNVGSSPATALVDPSSSPWKALYTVPGEPKA